MEEPGDKRGMKWMAAVCFSSGALFLTSCDQLNGTASREAQFLARRVEALEKKIGELEGEIDRLKAGVPASAGAIGGIGLSGSTAGLGDSAIRSPGAPPPAGIAAGTTAGTGAVSISNRAAESLKSDVDRANILLLKAKQLQVASRSDLPQLIASLGIVAPEVDELRMQLQKLEADLARATELGGAGSPEATAVTAELEKLRFRLELACEGVRQRVLDDSREASARLQATSEERANETPRPGESPTP